MSQRNNKSKSLGRITVLGVVGLVLFGVAIVGTVLFLQHRSANNVTPENKNSALKAKAVTNVNESYKDLKIPAGLTEISRSSSNPKAGDQPNTTFVYKMNTGTTITMDDLIKDFEAQGYSAGSKTPATAAESVTLTPTSSQNKLTLIVSITDKNIVFIRAQENKRTDT